MNSNLKMTVERSKRRSYFISLVFITKYYDFGRENRENLKTIP